MPAAAAVVSVAVDYVAGDAIAAAATEIAGSTVAGAALTSAAEGAITGGITAGVTGGDVGQGILFGGVGGAAGGAVGFETKAALEGEGLEPSTVAGISKGVGTTVGGTASGVLQGQPFGKALEQGAISGLATGLSTGIAGEGKDITSQAERGLISTSISQGLGSALGLNQPSSPTQTASSYVPSTTTTTGQGGVTPGSQALGQALRVDPTATLGGGDQTSTPQNVWNVASLRVKDETGA